MSYFSEACQRSGIHNNNNNNLLIGCSITRVVYIEVLLLDVCYMTQLKYKKFKLKSIYMI